jgi:hypothetical protein
MLSAAFLFVSYWHLGPKYSFEQEQIGGEFAVESSEQFPELRQKFSQG